MPGAWEIRGVKDRRILLGMIQSPDLAVTMQFAANLRIVELPPGSDIFRVAGMPYEAARNQVFKMALENGYNLAFLDCDVRAPGNAFMQLWDTGLNFVSGLYYQRFPPYRPVCSNLGHDKEGKPGMVPIGFKPGDIFPADFIPAGLCLVRRPVLEAMAARFPLPYQWGVDIAPVPDYGGGQLPQASEDFIFSYRCVQVGHRGYIATTVVGLHEVRAVVGPKWVVPYPDPDPINGVVGVVA